MKIFQYLGKKIKLIDVDGQKFVGKVTDYTTALNNVRPFASIAIDTGSMFETEIYEDEIVSIELID